VSCRTGRLRGGRSLRDAYTGLGRIVFYGPAAGRVDHFELWGWSGFDYGEDEAVVAFGAYGLDCGGFEAWLGCYFFEEMTCALNG
jgi:hypothetical protein